MPCDQSYSANVCHGQHTQVSMSDKSLWTPENFGAVTQFMGISSSGSVQSDLWRVFFRRPGIMTWPRYENFCLTHWSFSFDALKPAFPRILQTIMEAFSQFFSVRAETMMSSAYCRMQTEDSKSIFFFSNVFFTAAERTDGDSAYPSLYLRPLSYKASSGCASGCTGTERQKQHTNKWQKYLCVHGIKFMTVGTSGTIRDRGIISLLIALNSCVRHHVFPSAFTTGLIGVLFDV